MLFLRQFIIIKHKLLMRHCSYHRQENLITCLQVVKTSKLSFSFLYPSILYLHCIYYDTEDLHVPRKNTVLYCFGEV